MKKTEEALVKLVNQQLEEAVDEIDMATRSRLTIARHKAFQEIHQPLFFNNAWLQSVVFTTVFVSILLLWGFITPTSNSEVIQTKTNFYSIELNEMDVLMSNEDIDFLENLEVYEWLEAEYG